MALLEDMVGLGLYLCFEGMVDRCLSVRQLRASFGVDEYCLVVPNSAWSSAAHVLLPSSAVVSSSH